MALTPNNQIEAILAGEDIPVSSRSLAFIKEAVQNGGGSGELPEVTSADDGKVLTVVDGAWAAAGGKTYESLGTIQLLGEIDDPSSIGMPDWAHGWSLEGSEAIIATFPHDTIYIQKDGEGDYYPLEYYDESWANNVDLTAVPPAKIRETDPAFAMIDLGTPIFATSEDWNGSTLGFFKEASEHSVLPEVTAADNGDVLTVVDGAWAKAAPQTELPSVSSSDNGDVLTVVNGAWAKASLPENLLPTYEFGFTVTPGQTEGELIVTPGSGSTYAEITAVLAQTPNVYAVLDLSFQSQVIRALFSVDSTASGAESTSAIAMFWDGTKWMGARLMVSASGADIIVREV